MKWTKNERFPSDKVGTIKDEISDKVKGVGARLEGFVSDGSEGGKSEDLRRKGKDDIIEGPLSPKKVVTGADRENHGMVQGESAMLDKDIVSTPKSIAENIVDRAMTNTSTSEYTPLEIGSLKVEKGSYYSHFFSLTPVLVTNRGCIQVSGKNFDYIQIIQRN
ncbi:MAG: hypothetical protein GEU26_07660 [Nitrososphaeraceae archaeon]|nr:hypothetical protein [Nitrososphaeraceae archaeon]